ncbi:hypothetical protein N7468_004779 [Penicillium chermesinum]|uniref:Uncharacterized protein n=1 Tax=Penicillium chermesinum TaxID=63820 RepID=A0A9W9TSV7_9EURO|nr:uncharacterized protein N7468_004779 [Penicillium chermesinum]KAJ5240160.1 hypothetical protein N7468_004779 [Penicillium chermesinum]KAJ6167034.1 hypothetical protein N7470_002481 [Penicillium chermesinum]
MRCTKFNSPQSETFWISLPTEENVRLTKADLINALGRISSWNCTLPIPAIDVRGRDWDDKQTLEQLVQSSFRRMTDTPDALPFLMALNIYDFGKTGRFKFARADSLQEHLTLSVGSRTKRLRIFHLSYSLKMSQISRDMLPRRNGLNTLTADAYNRTTLSALDPEVLRKDRSQHRPGGEPSASHRFLTWGRQLLELRDEYDRIETDNAAPVDPEPAQSQPTVCFLDRRDRLVSLVGSSR